MGRVASALPPNRTLRLGLAMILAACALSAAWLVYVRLGPPTEHQEGTARVPPGTFFEFTFHVYADLTEIYYFFAVESGPTIDIYLVMDEDYARYLAGQPIEPSSRNFVHEGVAEVNGSPYPDRGQWHAVVDNTAYGVAQPGGLAVVAYVVDSGGVGISTLGLICVPTAFLFLFGLFFAYQGYRAPPDQPPLFCPFCGRPSQAWRCPACGRAAPPGFGATPRARP